MPNPTVNLAPFGRWTRQKRRAGYLGALGHILELNSRHFRFWGAALVSGAKHLDKFVWRHARKPLSIAFVICYEI